MTTADDIPRQRAPWEEIPLSVASDFCVESFQEARRMLMERDDPARYLVIAEQQITREMIAWLWDNARGCMYCTVPAGALSHPETWALCGYRYAVISKGI